MAFLTIILSVVLAMFVIVGIICIILVLHITRQLLKTKQAVERTRHNVDSARTLVSQVTSVVGVASTVIGSIGQLRSKVKQRKMKGIRHGKK